MNNKGNALFLILIAVALFAALSYAITSSSRGSGSIDRDQAEIAAAELIQYTTSIEQAVNRLRVINGCEDRFISIQRDWDGDGTIENNTEDWRNIYMPATEKCYIYDVLGGDIPWVDPNPTWLDGTTNLTWHYPDNACIEDLGTNGSGITETTFCDGSPSTHTDIVITLPGISQAVCQALNKNLHDDATIPVDVQAWTGLTQFDGAFASANEIGDTAELMKAKYAYCFQASATTTIAPDAYVFYHVLWSR